MLHSVAEYYKRCYQEGMYKLATKCNKIIVIIIVGNRNSFFIHPQKRSVKTSFFVGGEVMGGNK